MIIVGFDPGLMSGLVRVVIQDGKITHSEAYELEFYDAIAKLVEWIYDRVGEFHIAYETYVQMPGRKPMPYSLELIGAMKALLWTEGITEQCSGRAPSKAKMIDNDRLRKYGLWLKGGRGHANDAYRHALMYAFETRKL